MSKEEIIAIDEDFQKLINVVVLNNTSGTFEFWHELWGKTIKPLNKQLKFCGWEAKDERLRSHTAHDDMVRILESFTTLK